VSKDPLVLTNQSALPFGVNAKVLTPFWSKDQKCLKTLLAWQAFGSLDAFVLSNKRFYRTKALPSSAGQAKPLVLTNQSATPTRPMAKRATPFFKVSKDPFLKCLKTLFLFLFFFRR
jgi:hypothetical protein